MRNGEPTPPFTSQLSLSLISLLLHRPHLLLHYYPPHGDSVMAMVVRLDLIIFRSIPVLRPSLVPSCMLATGHKTSNPKNTQLSMQIAPCRRRHKRGPTVKLTWASNCQRMTPIALVCRGAFGGCNNCSFILGEETLRFMSAMWSDFDLEGRQYMMRLGG